MIYFETFLRRNFESRKGTDDTSSLRTTGAFSKTARTGEIDVLFDKIDNNQVNLQTPYSTRHLIHKEESKESFSAFKVSSKKSFKINHLMSRLNEDLRTNFKFEESKQSNSNNNHQFKYVNSEENYRPVSSVNTLQSENKVKQSRVMKTIQEFSIDLLKQKKNNNNRPIVRLDNKADLKVDFNYILGCSPSNTKGLITLEKFNNEKINRKIGCEKKSSKEIYSLNTKPNSDNHDPFFDFSRKIKTSPKKQNAIPNNHPMEIFLSK